MRGRPSRTALQPPGRGGVMEFRSNEELFSALRAMIDRWCDDRRFGPLSTLLPGYLAFNGLTDGWATLYESLWSLRAYGPDSFSESDWELIHDLTVVADKAAHR